MPSAFFSSDAGPAVLADVDSDLDYSIASWLDGLAFTQAALADWSISPAGPTLHDASINAAPVTVDGKTFAAGELATVWITGLQAQTYTVTLHATFAGNRVDDRSFRLQGVQR